MVVFTLGLPRLPAARDARLANPIHAIRALTWTQQALFWSGWFAWITDSYDFFCVSLTILRLQEQFGRSTHALTTAITLTLLFRPVGAFVFGLLGDRYGRRWPLTLVLLIIAGLQVGTGFVQTFSSFLAENAMVTIGLNQAMGGVWGLASAASMESMPVESRGVYSGLMQVGYPGGYLVASVVNLFLVPETPTSWRSLFWVGAGLSTLAAGVRGLLPESAIFERSQEVTRKRGLTAAQQTTAFVASFREMLKEHWALWLYGVVLMTGLNFLPHSSQDLYTTFMQNSKGFSAALATKANIVGEAGAVVGAALGGFISQFLGRRITLIIACFWCCAFIPLWILPSSWGALSTGAFFFQMGVNIAWGTVAVYLNELAPPAFRGVYPGTVYQLGNAASSAASQIEATAGLTIRKQVHGMDQPDYGIVQAIMAAASCGLILLCALVGPENHSAHFEDAKTAMEERLASGYGEHDSKNSEVEEEKAEYAHVERVVRDCSADLSLARRVEE